jgi:hypothetical protein
MSEHIKTKHQINNLRQQIANLEKTLPSSANSQFKHKEKDRGKSHRDENHHGHKKHHKLYKQKRMMRSEFELMLTALSAYLSGTGSDLQLRKQMSSPEQIKVFRRMTLQMFREVMGTEEPEIRLVHTNDTVNFLTAGPTFTRFVQPLRQYDTISWAAWAILFDEFQNISGKVRTLAMVPVGKLNPMRRAFAFGCLDYGDANNPSHIDAILGSDTEKCFPIETYDQSEASQTWDIKPQGQPDDVWQSVASTTAYMWWKWYFMSGSATGYLLANNDAIFQISYYLITRFRQVALA